VVAATNYRTGDTKRRTDSTVMRWSRFAIEHTLRKPTLIDVMKSDQFIHQYSTMKNSVYYYVSIEVNKLLSNPIIDPQRLKLYCFGVLAYTSVAKA
jgi:hypothetical protein